MRDGGGGDRPDGRSCGGGRGTGQAEARLSNADTQEPDRQVAARGRHRLVKVSGRGVVDRRLSARAVGLAEADTIWTSIDCTADGGDGAGGRRRSGWAARVAPGRASGRGWGGRVVGCTDEDPAGGEDERAPRSRPRPRYRDSRARMEVAGSTGRGLMLRVAHGKCSLLFLSCRGVLLGIAWPRVPIRCAARRSGPAGRPGRPGRPRKPTPMAMATAMAPADRGQRDGDGVGDEMGQDGRRPAPDRAPSTAAHQAEQRRLDQELPPDTRGWRPAPCGDRSPGSAR